MDKLLQRSADFEKLVVEMLMFPPYDNSARIKLSRTMCSIAIEHAESAKILLAAGNFTSSHGLLRLQFEALVRALWFFYAAPDLTVEMCSADLTTETEKTAQKLPMLSNMLEIMEGKAPQNALDPLLEFKEYSWKPLNSFVHGGLHAIDRHSKGYPEAMLEQTLRVSNGVSGVTGYFLAILTGNSKLAKDFHNSFSEYKDCLPQYRKNNS